jgi:hypothetical protein
MGKEYYAIKTRDDSLLERMVMMLVGTKVWRQKRMALKKVWR